MMKTIKIGLLLAVLSLAGGNSNGATIRVPTDQPNIQMGIDSAGVNDTVLVASGTYTGEGNRDIEIDRNRLVVISEKGPDSTIIDCEGTAEASHRGFWLKDNCDTSTAIDGFAIRNGYGSGAGLNSIGNGVTIRNCILEDNHSPDAGGGVAVFRASFDIPRVVLADCRFERNTSETQGGGMVVWGGAEAILDSCQFTDNTASGLGGGLFAWDGTIGMTSCSFLRNEAPTGAGLFAGESILEVDQSSFVENRAGNGAGALGAQSSELTVTNSSFFGNYSWFGPGGIYMSSCSTVSITGSVFEYNNALKIGGAMTLWQSTPEISNCTFVKNSAEYGGVIFMDNSSPQLSNCILADNTGGGAMFCQSHYGPNYPILSCCNLYNNYGGDWIGCIAGQQNERNNMSVYPMFCDLSGRDYRLEGESPCAPDNNDCLSLIGALGVGCQPTDVPISTDDLLPEGYALAQNYPNPFNGTTRISYTVPARSKVQLAVYDLLGREVKRLVDGIRPTGEHSAVWHGRNSDGNVVATGVYFYRLTVGEATATRKMLFLK